LEALATCHGITYVNGILIGDPLDVKMFQEVDWVLDEPNDGVVLANVFPKGSESYKNVLLRRFDFTSALQRMSVIALNTLGNTFHSFVKGSPEKIMELSDKSSLPDDFEDVLELYTLEGYRVIALAQK
jgi:magnesium-transporting ATPase (P-type)